MLFQNAKRVRMTNFSSFGLSSRLFSSEISKPEKSVEVEKRKTGMEMMMEMNLYTNRDENEGMFTVFEGYYSDGFKAFNQHIEGPVCAFPKCVLRWNHVQNCDDLNMDSLFIFTLVKPRILLIGTGERMELIDPRLRADLRKFGIIVECLPSNHAISTFNILNEERRDVAAAILTMEANPPDYERMERENKDNYLYHR